MDIIQIYLCLYLFVREEEISTPELVREVDKRSSWKIFLKSVEIYLFIEMSNTTLKIISGWFNWQSRLLWSFYLRTLSTKQFLFVTCLMQYLLTPASQDQLLLIA